MHRKDKKKKVRDAGGTVSRGVRASTAATMALLDKQRQKAEKEKQESGLDDFYRFQKRENRKKGTHICFPFFVLLDVGVSLFDGPVHHHSPVHTETHPCERPRHDISMFMFLLGIFD